MNFSGGLVSIACFLFLTTGSADAGPVKKSDFLDWDYVLTVWTTMAGREQGVAEWNRVVPVYKEWAKIHSVMDQETLGKHPQAILIKQGHDLSLMYERWLEIYAVVLSTSEPKPWNQIPRSSRCGLIRMMNYFTQQCNDLPDWRRPEDRERDARVLTEYREARAKVERGRTCEAEEKARADELYKEYKAAGGDAGPMIWKYHLFPKAIKSKCWQ